MLEIFNKNIKLSVEQTANKFPVQTAEKCQRIKQTEC